jgi:hypothetical protein
VFRSVCTVLSRCFETIGIAEFSEGAPSKLR